MIFNPGLALWVVSAFTLLGGIANAVPQIKGVFALGTDVRLTLLEPQTGELSSWLRIGDRFAGYSLVEFDAKNDTLYLERDSERFQVDFGSNGIEDARVAMSGVIQIGLDREVDVNEATLLYGETVTFPVSPEVSLSIESKRRPDGNVGYNVWWETKDESEKTKRAHSSVVIQKPGYGFALKVGDLGFELKPKE